VTLQRLGVMPSFSRPSVSDDNPFSESLFRTLKYCPIYPTRPFADIEQARQWVHTFVNWYNNEHRHSGIKFVTPAQRHYGEDRQILENRQSVYEAAKLQDLIAGETGQLATGVGLKRFGLTSQKSTSVTARI